MKKNIKLATKRFIGVYAVLACIIAIIFIGFAGAQTATTPENSGTQMTQSAEEIVASLSKKDYSPQIDALFLKAEKTIDTTAYEHAKAVDAFRILVSEEAVRNVDIAYIAKTYALKLRATPSNDTLQKQMRILETNARELVSTLTPFIKDDSYVLSAVAIKYNLYPSFMSQIFVKNAHTKDTQKLTTIKEKVLTLRTNIRQTFSEIHDQVIAENTAGVAK